MAQFLQTASGDIQQIMVVPAEEAAAVGMNFIHPQPPPSHVVQFTTYQSHIHPSSLYHLAENVQSTETVPFDPSMIDSKVEVQLPLSQAVQPQNVASQQQTHQILPVQQQHIPKFHIIQPIQSPCSSKTVQLPLHSQTVLQHAQPIVTHNANEQLISSNLLKPKQYRLVQLKPNILQHTTPQYHQQQVHQQQIQHHLSLKVKHQATQQKNLQKSQQQVNVQNMQTQVLQPKQQSGLSSLQQQAVFQRVQQHRTDQPAPQQALLQRLSQQQSIQQPLSSHVLQLQQRLQQQKGQQSVPQQVVLQVQRQLAPQNCQEQAAQQPLQQQVVLQVHRPSAQQNTQDQQTVPQQQVILQVQRKVAPQIIQDQTNEQHPSQHSVVQTVVQRVQHQVTPQKFQQQNALQFKQQQVDEQKIKEQVAQNSGQLQTVVQAQQQVTPLKTQQANGQVPLQQVVTLQEPQLNQYNLPQQNDQRQQEPQQELHEQQHQVVPEQVLQLQQQQEVTQINVQQMALQQQHQEVQSVQEAVPSQHQQQGVLHVKHLQPKQSQSTLQQLQQQLAGQQSQMILLHQHQHIQVTSPQPSSTVPSQPQQHIPQRISPVVKNQQRTPQPLILKQNQRIVSAPVIIKRPSNQHESTQTVMMMYPNQHQIALQPLAQVAVQQVSSADSEPMNGVIHRPEVASGTGVVTLGSQSSQGRKLMLDPHQCSTIKATSLTTKSKTHTKSDTFQQITVPQPLAPLVPVSQDEPQAPLRVPIQPHGLQLHTSSSRIVSVTNVNDTNVASNDVKPQHTMDAQCQTVSVGSENKQILNKHQQVEESTSQDLQHQSSNCQLQLALNKQHLQKILKQHQSQVVQLKSSQMPHLKANVTKAESPPSPLKPQPSSDVSDLKSTDAKLTPGSECEGQSSSSAQMKHIQPNKVNYVLDANVFFKEVQLMTVNNNIRIIVHPEGFASLQQVKPAVVEQTVQEGHVTVFDGMQIKDEFPTGILQECVVSESGEVIIANPCTVTSESESAENNKTAELSSFIIKTEEPTNLDQVCLTNAGSKTSLPPAEDLKSPLYAESISDVNHIPRYVKGMLAVCSYCGILSQDFHRCSRCQRKMSENVKAVVDTSKITVNRKGFLPNGTTAVGPVMIKKSLYLPAEKLSSKIAPKPEQPLHGTVVISQDLKRKSKSHKKVRAKLPEEPEILTLSSDEEDKEGEKSTLISSSLEKRPTLLDAEAQAIASTEEMDCYDETRRHKGVEGGGMMEQAVDGSIGHPHVVIQCRTVRFGTFKEKPLDRVIISPQGIEIKLPPFKHAMEPFLRVSLKVEEIKKVLTSFCRSMPVLFIYVRDEVASRIRELLNMTDPHGSCYFDPDSYEETHKRITLLPEKLNDEVKVNLTRIFRSAMVEINNKLANEILVKSSPRENPRLRSDKQEEIKTIMVYPPPPAKGGISINTEDYACLGEDQFLNDVIIDFYLKYLMQSVLSDKDRERTHVFSSFFYKRLTSRPKIKGRKHPVEDDPKLSNAQKRHARVKSWTKNVNLFTKDFIIIPINESCHWFLAIICFPGQDGCRRMSDNSLIESPVTSSPAAVAAAAVAVAATNAKLKVQNNIMSIGSTTITPVKASAPATITLDHNGDEGSDRDEAEGDEEEMEEPSSDDEPQDSVNQTPDVTKTEQKDCTSESPLAANISTAQSRKPNERDDIKQPCILIFDSLVGAPRYRVVATLRDYLSIEYKTKEGKEKEFTKYTIKGMLPKVPQQNNFTDCGLYLLQYVESFFKNPIKSYHSPIKELQEWFPEEVVTRKREEIVLLLHQLMSAQSIDPNSLHLPVLSFSHNNASAEHQEADSSQASAELYSSEEESRRMLAVAQAREAEDTEAASRLVASMEPQGPVDNMENMEHQYNVNEDTKMETDNHVPNSNVNHVLHGNGASKTARTALHTCSVGESKTNLDNEISSGDVNMRTPNKSLVEYSESSNESSSEQVSGKRGTEVEDSIIDKKKRKCVNEEQ